LININVIKGFYGIVNVTPDGPEPVWAAGEMAEAGCRVIQLRWKGAGRGELVAAARGIKELADKMGFVFIVNDDPSVAAEVGADGVHVGQGDSSYLEARRMVGHGKLVGVSTHNEAELKKAVSDGADYAGFGPVFATGTKENPDPVQGIEGLRRAVEISSISLVAIGGINHENASQVTGTGVHAFTSIGGVYQSGDIRGAVARFVKLASGRASK
jgi:thiamine-phosphate diphosphorylase